jgi:hypothetical protein
MTERDDSKKEPTQKTRKGAEILVPTREAFLRDLKKVALPVPAKPERS